MNYELMASTYLCSLQQSAQAGYLIQIVDHIFECAIVKVDTNNEMCVLYFAGFSGSYNVELCNMTDVAVVVLCFLMKIF